MVTINPYLTFKGTCEEAFNFYKSVFGGEFSYVGRFKNMPPSDDYPPVPKNEENKIMHISLPISNETILMGCDTSSAFGQEVILGSNFTISINTQTKQETQRIFDKLSESGTIKMPLNETFWGSYFGMFTDKYGIHWMVSCDLEVKTT